MTTGPQPKPKSRRSWRGAQKEVRPPSRYNWQRDAADPNASASASASRGERWRLAAYLLIGALLLAAFVKSLLFVPPKTPFLLLAPSTVAPYEAPLPPDAWVAEDADRFRQLDDAGLASAGILVVHDASNNWHSASQGLEGLRQQLRQLAEHGDSSEAVIIYVSMHGVVDDVGNPCLILPSSPGTSELESTSWVQVSEVLKAIGDSGFRERTLKLLVLESSRFRINWGLGTIYNTFTDRLKDVVAKADVNNLVVFNSVSPGELGWSSADLRGSVFSHFLQRGLSGDADDRDAGGNEDRQVSLTELNRYVTQHVRDWVWRNRGEHQHPLLLTSRRIPAEATISWALRPAERAAAQRQNSEPPLVEANADRERFWRQCAMLNEAGAATTDPLAWSRLQQALLRFEQCLAAGRAYTAGARDARATITGLLRHFDEFDSTSRRSSDCLIGTRRHDLDVLKLFAAPSMPLSTALGSASTSDLQATESALDALAASADAGLLAESVGRLGSLPTSERLVEVHFLRLLEQYKISSRFTEPGAASTAITTRRIAERAAAPCDERLLALTQETVDQIDISRRELEDQLFAGLPYSAAAWEDVRLRYQTQHDSAAQSASDLRWRDQVLAELPSLGQWLTRLSLQTDGDQQEQLDGQIADDLRTLIRSVCRTTVEQFVEQSATPELRQDFQTLRARIDDEYIRLLSKKQPDAKSVRDALWLLDVPLLPQQISMGDIRTPVDARLALHTLVTQWTSQLAAGTGAVESEPPPGESDAERGARFLARIESSWRFHPAIEMFAADEHTVEAGDGGDVTMRLVAREAKLRQAIATLPDRLKVLRNSSLSVSDHAEARRTWSDAERMSRALAGLTVAPLDVDAPLELRKLDLEQLLIWHSQRALDDFYGSADTSQPPYFARAAGDCLAAARDLAGTCAATRQQLSQVGNLLDRRREIVSNASSSGLLGHVSDVVVLDETIPTSTTVSLNPTADHTAESLPSALAALYVDALPVEPGALPTVQIPILAASQQSITVGEELIRTLAPSASDTHAVILGIRGHQFAAPFEVANLNGTASRFVPNNSDSADVLVIGPQQRAPDVLFVLDCSASMQQSLALESGELRRFDAAMLALKPMLEELAREGALRIGVVLFGHRARWDHEHVGDVIRQTGYGRPVSPNQMPFDDVEVVLPIGRFDPTIAGQLFGTLKTVTPWGESPLYLALIEAIRQFPAADGAGARSIILVTDGLNSQFNAPLEKRKYLPDVLQALSVRQVPIHIVGFGIHDNEAQEAQQAYQELADSSQGSYAPIEEATELVEHVRGLMTRETYSVQDNGRYMASTGVGSVQHVERLSSRVQPLTVSAANAAIDATLEGGESLRLQLSSDGSRLTVAPYLAGNPQFYPLSGGAGGQWSRPNFVVHRPLRRQNDVEFEFSLQDPSGALVPRPRTLWIEVMPLLSDGTRGDAYTFYDRNFEADVGVPALRWRAANWPEQAAQADVQFFCRFDAAEPDVKADVTIDRAGVTQTVAAAGPVGGIFTIERIDGPGTEWRVVEQYESESPEFPAFRVDLISTAGMTEVIRRFDARHQVCLHRFRVSDTDASNALPPVLQITRRDRERVGAWQLETPVRVDIATADGLIVLPNP